MSVPEESRVLIIAPVGQDAEAMAEMLGVEEIRSEICADPEECLQRIGPGAGALLMTEDALELPGIGELMAQLQSQPAWSELPLIILTSGGESRLGSLLELASSAAGTVTLLERPMSRATLLRSVEVALRVRRRQYQLRDLLAEQERQQREIRQSEEKYRTLFDSIDEGFCIIEVLFDHDGHANDYRFLEANGAFERHAGLPVTAVGKRVREVIPNQDARWFEIYGQIALTGEAKRFEMRGEAMGRFYDVYAFRLGAPEELKVAVLFRDVTERKGLERARAELRRKVDAALLAGEVATFEWDVTADRLWGDQNFQRMFEVEQNAGGPAPLAGFLEAIHPEDRPSVIERVNRTVNTGCGYEAEYRILRGGRVRWVVARGTAERDESGRVSRFPGVVVDITARKDAEAALQRSRDRLELLTRTVSALLTSPDPQTVLEDLCNEVRGFLDCAVFLNFLLDPETQRLRLNACGGIDPRLARTMEELEIGATLGGSATENGCCVLEETLVAAEDPARALVRSLGVQSYACHPLLGPQNQVLGILSFGAQKRDAFSAEDLELMKAVTDHVAAAMLRRRSQEALRESEDRFRLMADGSPLIIWVHSADGGLQFSNQAFRKFFGVTLEQVQGGNWNPLVHPEDQARYVDRFMECYRQRRSFEGEARVRRYDGRWRWIESHAEPRFSESGEFRGMVGSSLDITELKEFQEELERSVAERTAKLQELVGELEHFSYSITHDMRAPLRAMMAFAQMLEDSCADSSNPEQKEFVRRIGVAAQRMDLLITDALNYSKAVRSELPLAPIDVGRLLRGMVETYPELQGARRGIRVDRDLPLVMGNEAGLTQCFSNLLGNAVKFAKPGHPPDIRVRAEDRDGWVRLWVEDQGIGISAGLLPRIFSMFARGVSEQAGTGIGLALVRKVVDRMGGNVGVESDEGGGSRFWVELKPGQARPPFGD